jgi:hypothetical protein
MVMIKVEGPHRKESSLMATFILFFTFSICVEIVDAFYFKHGWENVLTT